MTKKRKTASSKPRLYKTPFVLSDAPLERDDAAYFHFDEFAITLARLIADKDTRTPLTIGVSGAWGSGKTTLLRRLQRQLEQTDRLRGLDSSDNPNLYGLQSLPTEAIHLDFANPQEASLQESFRLCKTIWFNAWKYTDEDELLVALVRVIVQSMAQDDCVHKMIGKLLDPSYPRRDVVETVLGWFSIKLKAPGGTEVTAKLSTGEARPTVFAEKAAVLDLFDEAFDRLMAAWVHHNLDARRIDPQKGVMVVFIDDLDRCLPAKTVQVLEAIKLFLDRPGCIFVLGADTEVVRQAVESYYQNAHVTGQNASDYLEKIIQLRFDLPPVAGAAMRNFLQEQPLDAPMLDQWETLIAAAEINPRRVKAVLNDIDLQWHMLVNSGQAQEAQHEDFIRWSALLRAAPSVFRRRLFDIDDPDLRLKFVQDALRWGSGEANEVLQRTFQEYQKDGRRLQKVLRQIGRFGAHIDASVLDTFLHLAAAPASSAPLDMGLAPDDESEPGSRLTESAIIKGFGLEVSAGALQVGEIEFVRVPAGKFLMGSKEDNPRAFNDERPQHTQQLSEYWIGRFPVTNRQFAAFVQERGYCTTAEEKGSGYVWIETEWKDTPGADWRHPRGAESSLDGKDEHPAVLLSWLDAMAFCEWLNETCRSGLPQGWQLRLPTEAEWEKAARGEYGSEWPWGSQEPEYTHCNYRMQVGDTTPVGRYSPQGDSPYGAADMAGSVWEWTHTLFRNYPYQSEDGRESLNTSNGARVLRGGSFNSNERLVRCMSRYGYFPDRCLGDIGLRVVASPIHL